MPDESDVKKVGTCYRMCKNAVKKRCVYWGKNADIFNKLVYVVVVGLITNDIIKGI